MREHALAWLVILIGLLVLSLAFGLGCVFGGAFALTGDAALAVILAFVFGCIFGGAIVRLVDWAQRRMSGAAARAALRAYTLSNMDEAKSKYSDACGLSSDANER